MQGRHESASGVVGVRPQWQNPELAIDLSQLATFRGLALYPHSSGQVRINGENRGKLAGTAAEVGASIRASGPRTRPRCRGSIVIGAKDENKKVVDACARPPRWAKPVAQKAPAGQRDSRDGDYLMRERRRCARAQREPAQR